MSPAEPVTRWLLALLNGGGRPVFNVTQATHTLERWRIANLPIFPIAAAARKRQVVCDLIVDGKFRVDSLDGDPLRHTPSYGCLLPMGSRVTADRRGDA